MMKWRYILTALFAAAQFPFVTGISQAAPINNDLRYRVTTVPDLPGGPANIFATDINNQGYISGMMSIGDFRDRGFVWHDGEYSLLEPLPGYESSYASAINSANWIAGTSILCAPERCTGEFELRATLWRPSGTGYVAVDLGLPSAPAEDSVAIGINDGGQIVGRSNTIGPAFATGFQWDDEDVTLLNPLPGGDVAVPNDINSQGQAVGFSRDFSDSGTGDTAVLWENGTTSVLFPGGASAINDSGQIVGSSGEFPNFKPILWENGITTELPAPPSSYVIDINNPGLAVGVISDLGFDQNGAAIWNPGIGPVMRLDELIDPDLGLDFYRADAINDAGVILAGARGDFANFYILTPVEVPAPGTAALIIPGFLMLYRVRRSGNGHEDTRIKSHRR